MFFNKKKPKTEEVKNEHIQVIPPEFYGGKDPIIYGREFKKNDSTVAELPRRVSYDSSLGGKLVNLLGNRVFKITILSVLSLAVLLGISFYYFSQAGYSIWPAKNDTAKTEQTPPVVDNNENKQDLVENIQETKVETTSTFAQTEPTTTLETSVQPETKYDLENQSIDFPKSILADSVDADSDSLTDAEELIFGTDPQKWDGDGDGYYDGQEVANLYNPKGLAPVKIIDSGLVSEYVSPNWQYRLYYPSTWIVGAVDKEAKQVLFTSASGDYLEVLVFQMQAGENFPTWFGRKALGQNYTDLTNFTNRFKENSFKRQDGLVYYFVSNNQVFVLLYHTVSTDNIPYRNMIRMAAESFRPGRTSVVIPDQTILPAVPTTTP